MTIDYRLTTTYALVKVPRGGAGLIHNFSLEQKGYGVKPPESGGECNVE